MINGWDRDPDKSTVEHREDGEKYGIKASLKEKNWFVSSILEEVERYF